MSTLEQTQPGATTGTETTSTETSTGLRVWINGVLHTDPDQALIPAVDHGLVVGDGVFEALKVTAAGPFAVQRHLDRLTRSARALGLPEPDHHQLRAGIEATLAGRSWDEGKIRITYTGGRGPLGSQEPFGPPTAVVAAEARTLSDPIGTIVTAPWTRNTSGAMTGVKTTSYGENVRALAHAHRHNATESIFINTAGNVCEGTGSNIFWVFGDRLVTPPLTAGPLAGVTRGLLVEWLDVEQADMTYAEAVQADEVFITSSIRDVQAVSRWDDHEFPAVGPRTAEVVQLFAEQSSKLLDP